MKGSVCYLLTLLVEAEDLSSMGVCVLGYVSSTLTVLCLLLQLLSATVLCVRVYTKQTGQGQAYVGLWPSLISRSLL